MLQNYFSPKLISTLLFSARWRHSAYSQHRSKVPQSQIFGNIHSQENVTPRLPDLKPLPKTLDDLKGNIVREIKKISKDAERCFKF